MKLNKILLFVLSILSFCLIACNDTKITISISGETTVLINENITLTAKASDNSKDFKWISSDENIAVVEDGIVFGVNEGNVIITVYLENDSSIKAEKEIKVIKNKDGYNLSVSKNEVSLSVGESINITANVEPNVELKWTSDNETIASVNNGKITGIKNGKTVITVSTIDNKASLTINVNVIEKEEGYTRNDLKNDLCALKDEYILSTSVNLFLETNNESFELIYNKANDTYENFKYAVNGNTKTITYVKDGIFYSEIEGSKKKSTLTSNEALNIVNQYNANLFLKDVTSFYNDEAFYVALNKKQETNDYVEFELIVNDYLGTCLNIIGVDSVLIKVNFENSKIISVELIYVTKGVSTSLKVHYRGIGKQNIEYPSDLDSYIE